MLATRFAERKRNDGYCGMVFVEQVCLATPLAWLLQLSLGDACMERVDVVVATGIQSMTEVVRNDAFDSFAQGRSHVLVCSNCAEEGVDVTACAFVVRFSMFHTTKSHKQGIALGKYAWNYIRQY